MDNQPNNTMNYVIFCIGVVIIAAIQTLIVMMVGGATMLSALMAAAIGIVLLLVLFAFIQQNVNAANNTLVAKFSSLEKEVEKFRQDQARIREHTEHPIITDTKPPEAETEPDIETEPVIETEPDIETEPVIETEPDIETEPIIDALEDDLTPMPEPESDSAVELLAPSELEAKAVPETPPEPMSATTPEADTSEVPTVQVPIVNVAGLQSKVADDKAPVDDIEQQLEAEIARIDFHTMFAAYLAARAEALARGEFLDEESH